MAYFFIALWAMIVIGGGFVTLSAFIYVLYEKYICGNPKSIRELFWEF